MIKGDLKVKRDAIACPRSKKNTILAMSYTVTKINFAGIEDLNMKEIFRTFRNHYKRKSLHYDGEECI